MSDATDQLLDVARRRLQAFAARVERIRIEDLPTYAVRPIEPAHGEALERAESAAASSGLQRAIHDARDALAGYLAQAYVDAQLPASGATLTWGGLGTIEDRVRVTRSLGDAGVAVVLWDALAAADRASLLGLWANLID